MGGRKAAITGLLVIRSFLFVCFFFARFISSKVIV